LCPTSFLNQQEPADGSTTAIACIIRALVDIIGLRASNVAMRGSFMGQDAPSRWNDLPPAIGTYQSKSFRRRDLLGVASGLSTMMRYHLARSGRPSCWTRWVPRH